MFEEQCFINFPEKDAVERMIKEANATHDKKVTMILQQLFKLKVLQKKDVVDFDMIYKSSKYEWSTKRFNLIVNLFPESLAAFDSDHNLPIHCHASMACEHGFKSVLKAGLKYYQRKLGFLFEKDIDGDRAIDCDHYLKFALSHDQIYLDVSMKSFPNLLHTSSFMMSYTYHPHTFRCSQSTIQMPSSSVTRKVDCHCT